MRTKIISERDRILVRRQVLAPGEASPWHTDRCRRFSVVVRGAQLRIEYRDGRPPDIAAVHPGMAGWDGPDLQVHRAVNSGTLPYEEVVMFFLPAPGFDPQPVAP